MYLHLGNNTIVKTNSIIGIFDLDNTTVSKKTRDFLSNSQKNNQVVNVSSELPKSFVVCCDSKNKEKKVVYINQFSSQTIFRRLKNSSERLDVYE